MKKRHILWAMGIAVLLAAGCGKAKNTEWKVTQYADESGLQANFYTLSSNRGELIIIDGGSEQNAGQVKEVIRENGGEVDAWILTHPHPDHIGAFVKLYEDNDIKIDAIYDNGVDYEEYDSVDQEWDDIAVLQEYEELTESASNVESVEEGDVLHFSDLSLHFLNSYRKGMSQTTKDMPNNSSLVFTVESEDKSMLFMGDCYDETLGKQMMQNYDTELEVDYVQVSHHGNHTMCREFYEKTKAKVAFFDAPEWLIQGEQFDTQKNMAEMEELGMQIYDYTSCPNEVDL
jgi:beta-lactamase superfamily II metal-dependent hydrolase